MTIAYVLTLVGSTLPLHIGHISMIENELADLKIPRMGEPYWLRKDKAAAMVLAALPDMEQIKSLRGKLNQYRIDLFVTKPEPRRKKLLIADMDSTIVTSETLDEIAAKAGIGDQVAPITARAMRGEMDFKEALDARVKLLKDHPESLLHEVLAETQLSQNAESLTATMRQHGAHCVLVSGGFTFFTAVIAARAGFDNHHGNQLEIQDGKLTGQVLPPILDKNAKLKFLEEYCERLNLTTDDVLAIGDGANDLPMLLEAGLGIGYRPKPLLLEQLPNCIIFGTLEAALYAQGYQGPPPKDNAA